MEVRLSLNDELLLHLTKNSHVPLDKVRRLLTHLETNDFKGFGQESIAGLSSLPYQWQATGNLAQYEALYASLLHLSFLATGVDVRSEEASSHGCADMVVEIDDQVFVLEFIMAEYAEQAGAAEVAKAAKKALKSAFDQMHRRGYGNNITRAARKFT